MRIAITILAFLLGFGAGKWFSEDQYGALITIFVFGGYGLTFGIGLTLNKIGDLFK